LASIKQYYGAINKGQFLKCFRHYHHHSNCKESKTDGEIVTVCSTVSDQFAGSAYIQDASGAIAVLIKQFMVLDYLK
jgi:hypothetical protein